MRQLSTVLFSLSVIISATLASSASAQEKSSRPGDSATGYELDGDGGLYRLINGKRCQVTNDVADFKIASHPDDAAVIYFIRAEGEWNALYSLANTTARSNCPKAEKQKIVDDVATSGKTYRYNVVGNGKSKLVAIALSSSGILSMLDDEGTAREVSSIADYRLHSRFGVKGVSYNRYVAFTMDERGRVKKIDGKEPGTANTAFGRFRKLGDFLRTANIN